MSDVTYRPRGDLVLLRRVRRENKIAVSDRSVEGWDMVVVSFGPDEACNDLQSGDVVQVITAEGAFTAVPRTTDLYLTRQSNVALIEEK